MRSLRIYTRLELYDISGHTSLTYGGDDGQRVEKRSGKRPTGHLLVGTLVAEVADRLDDVALEGPEVHLNFLLPLVFAVRVAAHHVPDPVGRAAAVRAHPVDDGDRVAGRALDDDEYERAGDRVTHHQTNDADVAEQERYELPQVVLALLRPRLFPLVVVPPAAPFSFHACVAQPQSRSPHRQRSGPTTARPLRSRLRVVHTTRDRPHAPRCIIRTELATFRALRTTHHAPRNTHHAPRFTHHALRNTVCQLGARAQHDSRSSALRVRFCRRPARARASASADDATRIPRRTSRIPHPPPPAPLARA